MIQLSSITNAISNVAHSTAVHAKSLCVNSKVNAVFRTTVSAMQAHPYITLLGAGVVVYCCRGEIGGLINKVKQAAHSLYTKATGSMISLIHLFKRSPALDPAVSGSPNVMVNAGTQSLLPSGTDKSILSQEVSTHAQNNSATFSEKKGPDTQNTQGPNSTK